jgi:hypothetical protein
MGSAKERRRHVLVANDLARSGDVLVLTNRSSFSDVRAGIGGPSLVSSPENGAAERLRDSIRPTI